VSKIILFVILLLVSTTFGSATEVTLGFENLENVCGQNFSSCNAQTVNPYQFNYGIQFVNGSISRDLYPHYYQPDNVTFNSIFPFGSYYLDISGGTAQAMGPVNTQWLFTGRYDNTPRLIYSISFLVLGKNGDVFNGTRQAGNGVIGNNGVVRNCSDTYECPGYASGFDVAAFAGNDPQPRGADTVLAISYGQAGYDAPPQNFGNTRVTISSAQGFDRLEFTQFAAMLDGNPLWGLIAIDQITFDEAPTPEPGTFAAAGLAFVGLAIWRRRQTRA